MLYDNTNDHNSTYGRVILATTHFCCKRFVTFWPSLFNQLFCIASNGFKQKKKESWYNVDKIYNVDTVYIYILIWINYTLKLIMWDRPRQDNNWHRNNYCQCNNPYFGPFKAYEDYAHQPKQKHNHSLFLLISWVGAQCETSFINRF